MQDIRVYCINCSNTDQDHIDISDEHFIALARAEGRAYSLEDFAESFNNCDVNTTTDIIRFVSSYIEDPIDRRIINNIDQTLNDIDTQIKEGQEKSYTIGWMMQAFKDIKSTILKKS